MIGMWPRLRVRTSLPHDAIPTMMVLMQAVPPLPTISPECLATIIDLLPGGGFSTMRTAVATANANNLSLPDPQAGFTLFATSDTGFAATQGGPCCMHACMYMGQLASPAKCMHMQKQRKVQYLTWLTQEHGLSYALIVCMP